jgi:hypothetical protein
LKCVRQREKHKKKIRWRTKRLLSKRKKKVETSLNKAMFNENHRI